MTDLREFALPDLGEGLTEGEILRWLVAEGDPVSQNQPIVEVETAKAAVEIPAKWAGRVARILQGEGTTVEVGTPIIAIDTQPEAAEPEAAGPEVAGPEAVGPGAGEPKGDRIPVLVGYGPRNTAVTRRPRRATRSAGTGAEVADRSTNGAGRPLATPPVRRLARDLGIDLARLSGTGPSGSITREDVRAATTAPTPTTATSVAVSADSPAAAAASAAVPGASAVLAASVAVPAASVAVPAASAVSAASMAVPATGTPYGSARARRVVVHGVHRAMAENMVASASTAPQSTVFLTVDVTRSMRALQRLREHPDWRGTHVSPLLLAAKAVLVAVGRRPLINSSWVQRAGESPEIVIKEYVNLGVAAATQRGLLVPNIKDADRLPLRELADALAALTTTAREGRTTPADLADGTITITNVGVFGVDTGTPILPPGQTAILALGAVKEQPWVVDGRIRARQVTTLGATFDHRVVDGESASLFLRDVGAFLTDPATGLLAWT